MQYGSTEDRRFIVQAACRCKSLMEYQEVTREMFGRLSSVLVWREVSDNIGESRTWHERNENQRYRVLCWARWILSLVGRVPDNESSPRESER